MGGLWRTRIAPRGCFRWCLALSASQPGLRLPTRINNAATSDAGGASAADARQEITEIEVTGYRLSLRNAIEVKRNSDVMMDAINAEDIADFPDANLAESLQRLPGIALDRDNGEGRSITVRGLGSDFTRVRLNGLETLTTGASNDSGAAPNRGRGFDFNVFASDLFSALEVRKTASANTDEGSLGATIDLVTGKPLDYKDRKLAFSAEDAFYQNEGTHNPRLAALFADQFFDDKLGFAVSVAYSERDSEVDRFRRQQGQSDLAYRGSSWAGDETAAARRFLGSHGHHVRHGDHQSRGAGDADRFGSRRLRRAVSGRVQHRRPVRRQPCAHSFADQHRAAGPRRRSAWARRSRSSGGPPNHVHLRWTRCIPSSIRKAT